MVFVSLDDSVETNASLTDTHFMGGIKVHVINKGNIYHQPI